MPTSHYASDDCSSSSCSALNIASIIDRRLDVTCLRCSNCVHAKSQPILSNEVQRTRAVTVLSFSNDTVRYSTICTHLRCNIIYRLACLQRALRLHTRIDVGKSPASALIVCHAVLAETRSIHIEAVMAAVVVAAWAIHSIRDDIHAIHARYRILQRVVHAVIVAADSSSTRRRPSFST